MTIGANWPRWASKQRAAFVNLEQDLGADWTLRLYGNYTRNTGDLHLLFLYGQSDRTTGIGLGASPARYDSIRDQWDTMARLTGTYSLFGRRHELIAGAGYAAQKLDFFSYATDYTKLAPVGDFNRWDGSYPEPAWSTRSLALNWKTKQWGYYAATRLSLAAFAPPSIAVVMIADPCLPPVQASF